MAASPGLEPLVMAHKGHTRVKEPGWGCFPCRGGLRSLGDPCLQLWAPQNSIQRPPSLQVTCNDA